MERLLRHLRRRETFSRGGTPVAFFGAPASTVASRSARPAIEAHADRAGVSGHPSALGFLQAQTRRVHHTGRVVAPASRSGNARASPPFSSPIPEDHDVQSASFRPPLRVRRPVKSLGISCPVRLSHSYGHASSIGFAAASCDDGVCREAPPVWQNHARGESDAPLALGLIGYGMLNAVRGAGSCPRSTWAVPCRTGRPWAPCRRRATRGSVE